MLANDGARVFSADIDSIQEYTKRPPGDSKRFHARHVVRPCTLSLEECLAAADVVVGAVPSTSYKVRTANLKDGCVCINVSSEKNFETDVRHKVCSSYVFVDVLTDVAGVNIRSSRGQRCVALGCLPRFLKTHQVTIMMLLRNLYVPKTLS